MLRIDRIDEQVKVQWDRPSPFSLLPYAAVVYHGAPAELRDIPIGTHLHALFHEGPPVPQYPAAYVGDLYDDLRRSKYLAYSRVAKLEDDFSYLMRQGRSWRVDTVDEEAGKLTVTGLAQDGKADDSPTIFFIGPDTRVWKGRGLATLSDLKPGLHVLANLTHCTLKGPGRCTDLWLDDESRALTATTQNAIHDHYQYTHGLAGWVDAVDNKQGTVSITLFAGVDPKLLDTFLAAQSFSANPGKENLRTWDQVNVFKTGPGAATKATPVSPYDSGVRIQFRPSELLEGFRPRRIVRLWPEGWKIDDLPLEERMRL